MPDYKQGKIYTIRCKTDDTLIYVGSTIEPLCKRMSKHKYDSLNKPTIFFINILMIGIIGIQSYLKNFHVIAKKN